VNLTENFITADAFFGTEINVFMLLKLVMLCRDIFGKNYFLVFLMNSQICEKLFRILRSNTTVLSTILNFSPLEVLERMRKIQLQSELINDFKHIFEFEKNLVDREFKFIEEDMPSDDTLENTIKNAFDEACLTAKKLGIFINERQLTGNKFLQ
jgi:hypothetical protein